jgi:hypothetical protein
MGEFKMQGQESAQGSDRKVKRPVLTERELLIKDLHTLPGAKILNRILQQKNPRKLVQSLSSGDFLWLVKKIGEEDCLPLLELATVDQWQYLLDLETWQKDRVDMANSWVWINRLLKVDPRRLVRWLFGKGGDLASYHFFRSIEVIVLDKEDEAYDLPEGYFSLDGVFHVRVIDSGHRETIENILREMAKEDFNQYQALLLGLANVIPAELEEGMHRLRNVRLAEHGFLPYEEAIGVYAPLEPEALSPEGLQALPEVHVDEEVRTLVPVSPLYHTETENMLTEAASRIVDPVFLDRIRLEFAGLCNQIISTEGLQFRELEDLIRVCGKAARTLNLALERLCGGDVSRAQEVLRRHSLVSLFRVGFGLALKLKWEAEGWLRGSWFYGLELDTDFWGEHWGGILAGLLEKSPRLYVELQEDEGYRDFEWVSELGECLRVLRRLMVLDSLMERLAASYPMDEQLIQSSGVTFHPFFFNLWGRGILKLEPSFSGLSLSQARRLFRHLRGGSSAPPYTMPGFEEVFVSNFMAHVSDADPEAASILREALALIWQTFYEEYKQVSMTDLDSRYSKYITITP